MVLIVYSCSTPLALCVSDAVLGMLGIALNWGSGQAHCGDGFLLSKRHVSTDVCWGYQQPTVISPVHEVAVRAALAVWALARDLRCHYVINCQSDFVVVAHIH